MSANVAGSREDRFYTLRFGWRTPAQPKWEAETRWLTTAEPAAAGKEGRAAGQPPQRLHLFSTLLQKPSRQW